eukprot:1786324-Rhodomonas_salina.2
MGLHETQRPINPPHHCHARWRRAEGRYPTKGSQEEARRKPVAMRDSSGGVAHQAAWDRTQGSRTSDPEKVIEGSCATGRTLATPRRE